MRIALVNHEFTITGSSTALFRLARHLQDQGHTLTVLPCNPADGPIASRYAAAGNRRILVVNLPTLENSGETTASLGRLVVSSLRNMMAQTLGADLEGDFAEIVENKPHLAPTPFPVVFDEVGYYVVPGMDKMLAMGRGLGFMFYLGFQEVAGLRARIGDSMYSLLGNANLLILMRLQEGSETRKYVEQTAGDTNVTQASSFQANEFGVSRENMNADVRQVSRVNWTDLRSLIEGEAIVLLGKDRVYAKLFYAEIDARGPMRMNRAVMLMPPAASDIRQQDERRERTIKNLLSGKTALQQADIRPAFGPLPGPAQSHRTPPTTGAPSMLSHMPAKVLAVFGLLTIATAAQAAVECPRSSQEHGLTTFSLFEGDPAKQVELAPGSAEGPNEGYVNTWPLRSSVGLVAVCRFEGAPEQRLPLPPGLFIVQS